MFFLNFGLAEFVMLAGAASLATIALYFLDRSRRRQVVSTLRFWTQAQQPVQTRRRRRLQQPWSLLLQLLGVLLLLIAIAQPRIGNPFAKPGYHVLVLETSAWMNASRGRETLMDGARRRAQRWLTSVPASDPVMLIRADALPAPATAFESDHRRVAQAIAASQPGATALDIDAALAFARRAQALQNVHGEIAFVGTGRIKRARDAEKITGHGLRVMLVPDALETAGLRRLNAKRSAFDPSQWDILATVRNYGERPRAVTVSLHLNGAPMEAKRLVLAGGATQEVGFTLHSRVAGVLEARLSPEDSFPEDNRAVLSIPALPALDVVVYTERPEVLRPFFAADEQVNAQFRPPSEYRPDTGALVVLDRFRPAVRPQRDTIWIDPRSGESPVPVVKTVADPQTVRWIGNNPLGAGLHAQDTRVAAASVLQFSPGDIRVAEIDEGPILLARPGAFKTVVIGFDPGAPGLRYRLSTPLAFANVLRWINPESFRQKDFTVEAAGSVAVPLDEDAITDELQVSLADGTPMPFTVDHHTLHFFSGSRENVRVVSRNREWVYALTLPEMWDTKWEPPSNVLLGVPAARPFAGVAPEIWPWLATLGAAFLVADWFLFSGAYRARLRTMPVRAPLRKAS